MVSLRLNESLSPVQPLLESEVADQSFPARNQPARQIDGGEGAESGQHSFRLIRSGTLPILEPRE